MNTGDIPPWLDGPPDFDRADPSTPLFDDLWGVFCMGRHSDDNRNGVADQTDEELDQPERFAGGDGSVYRRVSADEFDAACEADDAD